MIKLEDFVIEVDGVKYVPLDLAQAAQIEGAGTKRLDDAMSNLNKAIDGINNSINDALKDD